MKLKLLFDSINKDLKNTVHRFPYAIVLLLGTVLLASYVIEFYEGEENLLVKLFFSSSISFLLIIIIKLYFETFRNNHLVLHILNIISILGGVLIFMFLPDEVNSSESYWIPVLFSFLICSLILLLSLIPFIKNSRGFLIFNKGLFTNFWASFFISLLVFGGISLLFLAFENLFNFSIHDSLYGHLALWCFAFLGLSRFLSELPSLPVEQDNHEMNPFLRFITTYIGIPIAVIYGLVAYVYLFKIVFSDSSTIEWINPFLMWLFGIGFVSYFLNKLISNKRQINRIFNRFWLWYILPILIYFLVNLFNQISNSFLDIEYYYLIVAGGLFLISSILLLVKGNDDLRMINYCGIALCLVSILPTGINAWNAPINDQKKKLVDEFSDLRLIENNKFVRNDSTTTLPSMYFEILSSLNEKDELSFLKSYDSSSLLSDDFGLNELNEKLGIRYEGSAKSQSEYLSYNFQPSSQDVSDYDQLIPVISFNNKSNGDKLSIAEGKPVLYLNGKKFYPEIEISDFEQGIYNGYINDSISLSLTFHQVYGELKHGSYYLTDLQGICLVRYLD